MKFYIRLVVISLGLYGCGLRVSIKLPSINMSWADELAKNMELARKVSTAVTNVIQNCEGPGAKLEHGDTLHNDEFNKCLDATRSGFDLYLDIVGKEEAKKNTNPIYRRRSI